jgi:hypothetical protein
LASAPHFLGKGNLVSCLEANFLDVEVLESVEEIDYRVRWKYAIIIFTVWKYAIGISLTGGCHHSQ